MIYDVAGTGIRQLPDSPKRRAGLPGMGPAAELLAAALNDELDLLTILDSKADWPAQHMAATQRATIVMCCGLAPPQEWTIARHLRAWAQAVFIMAEACEPQHYELARQAVHLHRCVAVVECADFNGEPWARTIACPNTSLIRLHPGAGHKRRMVRN